MCTGGYAVLCGHDSPITISSLGAAAYSPRDWAVHKLAVPCNGY